MAQRSGGWGSWHRSEPRRETCRLADAIYVAEIDLDALTRLSPSETLRSTPLPRFPSVVRDLSILVDDALSADTVRGTIRAAASATLILVREFDRYQGKGIPDGKVSLSLRLTFQSVGPYAHRR